MSDLGERSIVRRVFLNGRERRLRAGWRLLLGVVTYGVAGLVAALAVVLVGTVASVFLPVTGGQVLPFAFAGQLFWNVAVTALLVGLAWLVDARTVSDLGLGGRDWWPNLGFGLVLGVVMTSVVFAAELAAGLVAVRDVLVTRPGLGIAGLEFGPTFALTLLFFVAVGIGEEVFFRGYLMTNLAEGLNGLGPIGPRAAIGAAAVLTSAVFGVVHLGNPDATLVSAVNITAVGIFFAATYVLTDDLGVPIGVHVTWNFSLGAIYGFPVSGLATPASVLEIRQTGDPTITGGGFGPEAGLVVYLALGVAIALTWLWVRRTEGTVGFPTGVAVPDLRKSPEHSTDGD